MSTLTLVIFIIGRPSMFVVYCAVNFRDSVELPSHAPAVEQARTKTFPLDLRRFKQSVCRGQVRYATSSCAAVDCHCVLSIRQEALR